MLRTDYICISIHRVYPLCTRSTQKNWLCYILHSFGSNKRIAKVKPQRVTWILLFLYSVYPLLTWTVFQKVVCMSAVHIKDTVNANTHQKVLYTPPLNIITNILGGLTYSTFRVAIEVFNQLQLMFKMCDVTEMSGTVWAACGRAPGCWQALRYRSLLTAKGE